MWPHVIIPRYIVTQELKPHYIMIFDQELSGHISMWTRLHNYLSVE